MKKITILIAGDLGVGKSSFVTQNFSKTYVPTVGVDSKDVTFYTSHGKIVVTFLDMSGSFAYAQFHDQSVHEADAAIIMFDLTRPDETTARLDYWEALCRRIPTVTVGNKADLHDIHSDYMTMSVATGHNCTEPLEKLFSQLFQQDKVTIII